MPLDRLDHVNILTADVERTTAWYCEHLGMTNGDRPPFPFPGAWLYIGDQPVIHLVGADVKPDNHNPQIEHFAFAASDLKMFLKRFDSAGVTYRATRVPGLGILQLNVFDCDGNHLHIDFSAEEADAAGL